MPPHIVTRRATAEDVDLLLAHVQAGFESYVEFAPIGWKPPLVDADRAQTLDFLRAPDTWALVAYVGSASAGHVSFLPARERVDDEPRASPLTRPLIAGLAHVWQLFVLPEHWGSGVAPLLHDAAVSEMRAEGYDRARLYTPAAHTRARRFYERRGWSPSGQEQWFEPLGLTVSEYRLELG